MCCPYFDPIAPQHHRSGSAHATLPLGDTFTGTCRAVPEQPRQPDDSVLRPLCNIGYARETCQYFPAADPGPDAVRFTISRHEGASIGLYYVLERDHQPFAHGPLACATPQLSFSGSVEGELTSNQARAYLAAYLRRKTEASPA
jgi:hypothetical protein